MAAGHLVPATMHGQSGEFKTMTYDAILLSPVLNINCSGKVVVSWVMVYIRRIYFTKHLKHLIERRALDAETRVNSRWTRTISRIFSDNNRPVDSRSEDEANKKRSFFKKHSLFKKGPLKHLRPDMIKRLNDAPKPVDPSGWVTPADMVTPQKESFSDEKKGSSHESHVGNGTHDLHDKVETPHSAENDLQDENEVSSSPRLAMLHSRNSVFVVHLSPVALWNTALSPSAKMVSNYFSG